MQAGWGPFYPQLNEVSWSKIFLFMIHGSCNTYKFEGLKDNHTFQRGYLWALLIFCLTFLYPELPLFLIRAYVAGIKRPFSVRYDPYTSSVEVLDNPLKIQGALDGLKDELKMLTDALSVLSWWKPCCCLLPLGCTLRHVTRPMCSPFCAVPQVWCCFWWVVACLTLAGWLTRSQTMKTSTQSAGREV